MACWGLCGIVPATLFYVVTNFAVWATKSLYAPTFEGLMDCYVQALPFYRTMLAGDVFRDNGVNWRLRVFKLIYFITALGGLKAQALEFLWRRRQARAVFTGGTTSQDGA